MRACGSRGPGGSGHSAQWYAARPAGGTTRSSRAASVGVAGGLGGSVAPTSVRTDSVGVQVDACRRRARGPRARDADARVAAAAARGADTRAASRYNLHAAVIRFLCLR